MLTEEVLRARLDAGLGGSESAAILGINPWKSAFSLWQMKVSRTIDAQDRMRLRFGNYAEPFIRDEYARESGNTVLAGVDMLKHPEGYPMFANTDGALEDGTIVELKTVGQHSFRRGWGDGPPLHYQIQCQHYMACLDSERTVLVAMVGAGESLHTYEVHRSESFINDRLVPACVSFWESVQAGRQAADPMEHAPPVDDSVSTQKALAAMYPEPDPVEEVTLPDDLLDMAQLFVDLGKEIGECRDERRGISNQLLSMVGPAGRGVFSDGSVLRRVRSGRGHTFKLDRTVR